MKTINLNDLVLPIMKSTDYDKETIKNIFGYIVSEIEFELLQGNKFNFTGVVSLTPEKIKYKNRYSPKYKKMLPVKNRYTISSTVARGLKNKLNLKKD